ncbi:tyrosine-type recombinase/integrase [Chloroflexota bacterium]
MNTYTLASKKSKASPIFEEFINRYKLSNRAEGKSEKTIQWYDEILKSFDVYLKNKGNSNGISCLNMENAREYILYLRNKPKFEGHPFIPTQKETLSPQTLRCHTRGLKAFSTWLFLNEYTPENNLKNLRLPKAPMILIEPLTPEEITKISSSIDQNTPTGVRNYTIFATALDNGLRASEITGITLGQFNSKDGYIKVMGKGAKERIVPVGEFVKMRLWHYIEKVRPEPSGLENDKLFLSRDGKPITVNAIKLVFTRLAKGSGVNRLHAHLCRHTFAINYLLNGGDIFSLKEILGHTTLDMVNHYLHFTSAQITAQHHKYSPMDKLQSEIKKSDK